MKKVLLVATVQSHIAQFHKPLINMLHQKGYEVHIAAKDNLKEKNGLKIENADKIFDVCFSRSPFNKDNIKAYKQLSKIVKENSYDIIHCNTPMGGVISRLVAKKYRKNGMKVIYTAHGFHFYKGAPIKNWILYYPIEKYLSRYTDCLITINQEDYNFAQKHLRAKQVKLVHGVGVDENKFYFEMTEEEKNKLKEELGIKKDDYVISYVGELNKNKNQIMIINVMKDLIKYNNNIKLLLIGNGNLIKFLENEIQKNNLGRNIFLLGYRRDVPKLLKITNLYISASKREGLPVNLIEAAMSGLPIVATNCRGNRELTKNIIEINDVADMTLKIKEIMNNSQVKVKYNMNKYKLECVQKDLSKIYNEIGKE